MGQRRADDDLLLRRRTGNQTRACSRRALQPERALLPAAGALGGMLAPALIFTAINLGGAGATGLGRARWRQTSPSRSVCYRCSAGESPSASRFSCSRWPSPTTSARILVIAIFYTSDINFLALGLAAATLAFVVICEPIGRPHDQRLCGGRRRPMVNDARVRHPRYDRRCHIGPARPGELLLQPRDLRAAAEDLVARFKLAQETGNEEIQQTFLPRWRT